jgi:hypothetical protein
MYCPDRQTSLERHAGRSTVPDVRRRAAAPTETFSGPHDTLCTIAAKRLTRSLGRNGPEVCAETKVIDREEPACRIGSTEAVAFASQESSYGSPIFPECVDRALVPFELEDGPTSI